MMYIYGLFVLFYEVVRRSCRRYFVRFACVTAIIILATGSIAALSGGSFGLAALYSLGACFGLGALAAFVLAVLILKNGFR